ncbi:PASTA domain-containing protein [Maribellus luteus]|uniref:PASTA domain-containing protein n=1 Tax=Maribellus luteus TaxID=2305463 RepID=A0A399SVQ7_9BACT|nr:PASTA domain-containing protein [Maribellus luteus]RIJ46879.1 PASTA domain-containing protein [Maribellus luteus]
MSLKKFLISRIFWINLLIAVVLVAALTAITLSSLKSYTHHGISYSVPDLSGMTYDEAKQVAEASLLKVELLDSVYDKNVSPGAVVDQVPKANQQVKEGRLIYLTINASEAEMVTIPKLTDISFRQAQVLLENCGLTIDSISYQPSEYTDLVLNAFQNEKELAEGDRLEKGSSVVLVVGQSRGNMETILPNLNGMFIDDARLALTNARLNMGVVIYDHSITTKEDTLNARIWKQMPDSRLVQKVYLGSSVDLWLTVDNEKLTSDEAIEQ